ncbi:MAG: MamI family restriction endonuclease [Prevotellaceae bacterium]|nr:MamI family restriction endonuclease [Prevotellaceae bacterium]
MKPNSKLITIDKNLEKIKQFINEIIVVPRHALTKWAMITNQTPAAKIGYIAQHLTSLITGVPGTGSGARGDDLADGSEVKSCNKVDQADKCRDCGARVLRLESKCSVCGSENIDRKDDSKWLFSIRDQHELDQYKNLDRVVLLLMDYPKFHDYDFKDIRITVFEIYPKDERMSVFNDLISNHYYNIFMPKQKANQKTNPMNLHPWSFQFYKCNPIKTFECTIENIDTNPVILIDSNSYVEPNRERDASLKPIPMPSDLLKANEWNEMLSKANYEENIKPLLDLSYLAEKRLSNLNQYQFAQFSTDEKCKALPFLDQKLRDFISLRPIISVSQKEHYQRS